MARPALRKVARPEAADRPRLARLDRDRLLVEAARTDPARFDALYRKYLAQVYSYAFYELRDHHEAEDATERTFLAALANLRRFEERARPADGEGASTFRVWLFQIARNAVAERRRRLRRRPEAPLEAAASVAAAIDIEGDLAQKDDVAAAWSAVGRLPDDRRRALILRFVDEMSTAEIAGVLGRSEGAVRVLIHRALRSVARDLDRSSR
jgi:RNA polymerase sigma-70 factor, ECF subfamily